MPRPPVTLVWTAEELLKDASRPDLLKGEPFEFEDCFIEIIELYGKKKYTIKHGELEGLRNSWRDSQLAKIKSCKDKYHKGIMEGEDAMWEAFAATAELFDKKGSKGTSGYVENVYGTYLIYKLYWEAATGFQYEPGNKFWRTGCLNEECNDNIPHDSKVPDRHRPGNTADYNIFRWLSVERYFSAGVPGQDYGVLAKKVFKTGIRVLENLYHYYPAMKSTRLGWYFLGPHFMARLYHFGVKHNFFPVFDAHTGSVTEKDKDKSSALNKMVEVPVGVVENDPNPSRVVMARFEETDKSLVINIIPLRTVSTGGSSTNPIA